MTPLGDYIQDRRTAKGLRSRDLADQTGIPATWIRNLENGRITSLPSPDRLRAIAAALGVTVTDLLIVAGYLDNDPEPEP
jgi:transcriptional regulator with XRE-family HTH domain